MSDSVVIALVVFAGVLVTAIPATIAAINSVSAKQAASTAKDVAHDATRKLDQLTINVDGRLALLMDKVEEAALAKGRAEGEAIVRVEVARAAEIQAATQAGSDAATLAAIVVPVAGATSTPPGPVTAALIAVTDAITGAITDTQEKVTDIHHEVVPGDASE